VRLRRGSSERRDLCPVGQHRAVIRSVVEGEGQRSGNPLLIVTYDVAQRWVVVERIPQHVEWRVDRMIDALGDDTDRWPGQTVLVTIEHELWDRGTSAVVRAIEAVEDENRQAAPPAVPGVEDDDLPF